MAVQAQYPSNLLFLNRNMEEENPQVGEDYTYNQQFHQNQMIFSSGVETNARKRSREIMANSSSPMNTSSVQPHPSQFIDLRLAFGEQQQQQQQRQQSLTSQSSVIYSVLSDDIAAQLRQQRDEVDQFLHVQGEQLRRALAEKRHRHHCALLGAAEEFVSRQLREKEAEAGRAAQRNAELEAQAARLSAEARAWQARAKAGEATAAALQAQLQHAVMSATCTKDTGGCGGDAAEDAESTYEDPDRVVAVTNNNIYNNCSGPTCRACQRRVATVVLLPCRHLSLCNGCDRTVTNQRCPVCFSFKESSVEVCFS